MLGSDDSFVVVMGASEREVMRVGGDAIGTEHVLAALLATGGPVAAAVQQAEPSLTVDSVRAASDQGVDDQLHLERVGIDPRHVLAPTGTPPPGPPLPARGSHTAEFQRGLESASVKLGRLHKSGVVPRDRNANSSVLWLAALEPDTRVHRLIEAMGLDAEALRSVVLVALTGTKATKPAWPQHAHPGPLTRVIHRFSTRLHVAR